MRRRVYLSAAVLTLLGCGQAWAAEVTIENPKNLPVREEQVTLLYTMICQEVAKTYHIRDYQKLERPFTLVLGEDRERYAIDSDGTGTIYLQKWDEKSFAACAAMLAVHNVLSMEQFTVVVLKTLERYRNVKPITVSEARTYVNDNTHKAGTNRAKKAGQDAGIVRIIEARSQELRIRSRKHRSPQPSRLVGTCSKSQQNRLGTRR